MNKKDFILVTVVGLAIGILSQPILATSIVNPSAGIRILALIGFTLFAPIALLAAYFLGKILPVLYQFAKFGAVGTLNTFIDIGVLNLLIFLTGIAKGPHYPLFKAVSFLVATANSYIWNKFWTFGSRQSANPREAIFFYVIAGIGWALNVATASLVVNYLTRPAAVSENLWASIGGLVGVGAAFLWNFLGYKFIVFKTKAESPDLSNG